MLSPGILPEPDTMSRKVTIGNRYGFHIATDKKAIRCTIVSGTAAIPGDPVV